MQVTLLGPVSCRHEGRLLPLGGLKQRAVFALLALEVGRVVPMDRLVDELWPDDPPAQAVVTLRAYVSRLRRVLEPTPATITTRRPGWVLEMDPRSTDLSRFTALVARARSALGGDGPGTPATAVRDLDAALDVWSGAALGDLDELPFARDAAARLGDLHDAAVETLLHARLADGDDDVVVDLARRVVADRPYRERGWGALITGLYRTGRSAEALETYATLRRTLADELGLDPSPELAELERQVLRHDPALRSPAPTVPAAHVTEPSATRPEHDARGGTVRTEGGWPLVGREEPLARVRAALASASGGRGGLVVVSGPAGSGKSTLLAALEDEVVAAGGRVLHGHGLVDGGAPALWPWVTALGELVDDVPGLLKGWQADDPAAAALAALAPTTSDAAPRAVAPLGQALLFRGVIDVLRRARGRGPLAVLLDDAHWADPDSWTLLALACDELSDDGVLFVAALRSDEPDAALARPLGSFGRRRLATVRLEALGHDDVAHLIEAIDGEAVDPAVAEAVLEQTGGNALFVTELVQLLSAEGRLTVGAATSTVPAGVRDVLGRRIERLPAATVSLLSIGSLVAPGPFDVDLLAQVSRLGEEQVLEACETALLAGLLVEERDGRLALSHGLLGEAVSARLSGPRRVHLHAKVAAALEQRGPTRTDEVLEVARHLALAAPAVGPAAAVPYLVSAAEDSLRRSASGAALSLLTTALDLVAQIDDARLREGSHALVQGRLDTVRMFSAAFGDDPSAVPPASVPAPTDGPSAGAWVGTVVGWAVRGHFPWAAAEASDVLAGRPGDVVTHLARYVRGMVSVMAGDRATARQDLDRLAADVVAGGPGGMSGMPFDFVDDVYAFRGLLAHQEGDEAAADGELDALVGWSPGSPVSQVKSDYYLGLVAALRGEAVDARTHARRCRRLARQLDFAVFESQLDVVDAWADALEGDADAPGRADEALAAYGRSGMCVFEPSLLVLAAEAHLHHGRAEVARERVRTAAARADATGQHYLAPRLVALAAALVGGGLQP